MRVPRQEILRRRAELEAGLAELERARLAWCDLCDQHHFAEPCPRNGLATDDHDQEPWCGERNQQRV